MKHTIDLRLCYDNNVACYTGYGLSVLSDIQNEEGTGKAVYKMIPREGRIMYAISFDNQGTKRVSHTNTPLTLFLDTIQNKSQLIASTFSSPVMNNHIVQPIEYLDYRILLMGDRMEIDPVVIFDFPENPEPRIISYLVDRLCQITGLSWSANTF